MLVLAHAIPLLTSIGPQEFYLNWHGKLAPSYATSHVPDSTAHRMVSSDTHWSPLRQAM